MNERLTKFLNQLKSYGSRSCIEAELLASTYAELLHEFAIWQTRLPNLGISSGTVVGVRADYSVFSIAALLALWDHRAITALIPRNEDAKPYLSDARATVFLEIDDLGSYKSHALAAERHALIDQLHAAGEGGIVIFTSGSTGRPKAALHSIERMLRKYSIPRRPMRTLAFLLLDHVAGLDTLFYTLSSGGVLVLAPHRDPTSILSYIEAYRAEVLPTSPTFLRMLCSTREIARFDLSSLKIITYGSELMDSATLSRVNKLFPGIQVSQKYGTTETGSPKAASRGDNSLWLTIKGDGVETRVVDGILWIRSEGAILGYLNAASPLDEAGWYCTGDLVEVDGEWIRFLGRATDIINVGGEKVSPAEVEAVILQLDFVRDTVVRAMPHALMGQVVTACVVLRDPLSDTREAAARIRLHCRQQLSAHKIPVAINFSSSLEVSDRHKVRRASLITAGGPHDDKKI